MRLQNTPLSASLQPFIASVLEESDEFAMEVEDDWELAVDNLPGIMEKLAEITNAEVWDTAERLKFNRELDEKYGAFKGVFLHPTTQWAMAQWKGFWDDFALFGEPPLPLTGCIVILVMMWRAKQGLGVLACTIIAMAAVHPAAIILVLLVWKLFTSRRYKPRGYKRVDPSASGEPTADMESSHLLKDPFEAGKLAKDYDVIVLGSNVSGLYAAGLLSRVGKRCLILEEGSLVGGDQVVTSEDGSWEFETGSLCLGRLGTFQELLEAARHPGCEPLEWCQVGLVDQGDNLVHKVVSVGHSTLIALPSGTEKFTGQLLMLFPEHRAMVHAFVQHLMQLALAAKAFFVCKMFPLHVAEKLQAITGLNYSTMAAQSSAELLQRLLPNPQMYAVFSSFFHAENLPCEKVAFGALVGEVHQTMEGQHYPVGGFRAIASGIITSVNASGGRVLTKVPVQHVILENGRATGVMVGGKPVRLADGGAVVSALGAIETFRSKLSASDLEEVGYPKGFEDLEEARPRVHLCVGLRGNWAEDLDVTASDFVQARDNSTAMAAEHNKGPDSDWFRVSFPTAKDPNRWREERTTCVMTAELSDEHCTSVKVKARVQAGDVKDAAAAGDANVKDAPEKGHSCMVTWETLKGRSRQGIKDHLLKGLHRVYPFTEGCDEYVELVDAARGGLSHTPARFKAEGLRAPTHIPGLYLGSEDLTVEGFEGKIQGGWLAAHAVLGYTAFDMWTSRTLIEDLKTVVDW